MTVKLKQLRIVAAPLLALATKELFPGAILLGGGATSLGFYYDFAFPFDFKESFIKEIEERMYSSIMKKEPITCREMVPSCAKGCLFAQKERVLGEIAASTPYATVDLVEIAGKSFLIDEEVEITDAGAVGAVKVLKFENLEAGVRIHGTAFSNKQELKVFLRAQKDWIGVSHIDLGKTLSLFSQIDEGRFLFSSKGLSVLQLLQDKIKSSLEQQGAEFISTLPVSMGMEDKETLEGHLMAYEEQLGCDSAKFFTETSSVLDDGHKLFSSGLFDLPIFQANFSHVFCKENLLLEEVISCLHFMTKIFKILDFEFQTFLIGKRRGRSDILKQALESVEEYSEWVFIEEDLKGSRIEWCIKDRMGKEWPISRLYAPRKANKTGEFFCFPFSVVLSFERLFALLLEKTKGSLPKWLISGEKN
jgi:threonyl-tRNA synthetase